MGGGAGVVGGEGDSFVLAVEAPEVFSPAALVALGLAPLAEPAGEEEGAAVGGVGGFRGLGERDDFVAAAIIDEREFVAGQGGVALGSDHQASIGRPAGGLRVAVPGAALGHAALDGHGVDLVGAFVAGTEGDGLAVGRDGGLVFSAGAGGEPMRCAAVDVDRPEVAFGREDDGVAVERGVGVIAAMKGRRVGGVRGGGDDDGG